MIKPPNIIFNKRVAPSRERELKRYEQKHQADKIYVAPSRERELKLIFLLLMMRVILVAPSRERELKHNGIIATRIKPRSLPHGSVN